MLLLYGDGHHRRPGILIEDAAGIQRKVLRPFRTAAASAPALRVRDHRRQMTIHRIDDERRASLVEMGGPFIPPVVAVIHVRGARLSVSRSNVGVSSATVRVCRSRAAARAVSSWRNSRSHPESRVRSTAFAAPSRTRPSERLGNEEAKTDADNCHHRLSGHHRLLGYLRPEPSMQS